MVNEVSAQGRAGSWRWLPALAVVVLLLIIYGGSALRGEPPALWWKALGVPAMEPSFFDAGVIGAWFELDRAGRDPGAANPLDPLKRTINYPPSIYVFSHLGWTRATTPMVGVLFALIYVLVVLLMTRSASRRESLYWVFLACAPACLLAVERGNMDVLILALVVLARHFAGHPWLASLFLGLATIWKLFAIAGLGALLTGNRHQRIAGATVFILCLCAFWLMRDSIVTTFGSLAGESSIAFGVGAVGNFWLENGDPGSVGTVLLAASLPVALLLAVGVLLVGVFHRQPAVEMPVQITFGAWLGALLFGVLFLSGTQFDYKLLFLWPMVPWVLKIFRSWEAVESKLAGLWLLCLLLASWWLFFSSDTAWRPFLLKQGNTWLLFLITAFFGGRLVAQWLQSFLPPARQEREILPG